MTSVAVILVLFSAVFHAFKSLFTKTSHNKYVFTLLYWLGGALILLPILGVYFLVNDVSEVEVLMSAPREMWLLLTISVLIHSMYFFMHSYIYSKGDLSLVYPLSRLSPLFLLIWSIAFFGETVTLYGAIGVLLTVIGTWMFMLEGNNLRSFGRSFKRITELTIIVALLTSLVGAVFSVIDKELTVHFGPALFSVLLSIDILITGPIVYLKHKDDIKKEWKQNKKNIILTSIFDYPGYYLVLLAFLIAPVTYIVSFRQISVVFGVLLGSIVLNEKYGTRRFIGALIITLGCVLITIFG